MILRAGRRPDAFFVGQIRKIFVFAAALAAVALVAGVAPAAAKTCGQKVVDDWYDNGRVDNVYPLSCYRAALKLLPDDVKSYSNAPDEINRALQDAIRQERDDVTTPGETGDVAGTTSNPSDSEPPPADTSADKTDEGGASGGSAGSAGGSGSPSPSSPPATPSGGTDSKGVVGDAIKNLGPGSADSIPVPLIIIGALALLLLAAGGAGLVARRLQERKVRADKLDDGIV